MSEPREFYSRRIGWRWQPVYVAGDGIERPLFPSLRFWRWVTSETVCMTARQHWNDGLWAAGGHPLQQKPHHAE